MRKIVSFILIFSMMFSFSASAYAENRKNSLVTVEKETHEDVIRIIEQDSRYLDYEKLTTIAGDNLIESKDGMLQIQISDIKKYSEDAGVSKSFAEIYLREANKVLKHVQDQGFTVDKHGNIIDPYKVNRENDITITAIGVDEEGTIEIDPFHDRTFFGRVKTEKMLDNLSVQAWVFTGISLGTAFKWTHLSFIAALCAAATAIEAAEITSAFRQSDYKGVRHDHWRIPASPDIEEWNPWHRQ
ncbi:hypothetical protein HZF24_15995 [Sedimentibacter hydroxybenzoicus DSM 7310]|uniref:Uncharacterized protein n=1 Tax=Sedimentibacter hydroxybenzoicus DSM 7310 TaxID=1123245 RepID=A0A974BN23_SEDHY|nr:hypothetical protein [Sedimentibacter hydroxybenzoicus]NYB75650.1 hypothetical protein [Sedimentibacter hydroxybenzoicus DSM 7310]